ncbi:HK97 family phage prohead protease [Clostridium sp. UBA4548]|uniref:HK97 family phage prohead protease n=1 Tax=Clostridium sp. UBA4548 TaxID=1946361 RepID=UPI0025C076F6|nr:HK97 family phage prohead protease [Clostridium sp. UBA4548]
MEKQYLNNKIEVRELECGYQLEILVNDYRDSRMLKGKNGQFIENVPQETWKKAIEENREIQLFIDHLPYVDVAETMKFEVREDGVYAIATLTEKAKNLYHSIKENGANGVSFGFKAIKDTWSGIKRTINEMQLFEISILMTKQPAYFGTLAEVRNVEVPYNKVEILKRRLALYKLR